MQLSRQEMLEAWTGEEGRGVGERETNLRASRVLTGLDDQQMGGGGEEGPRRTGECHGLACRSMDSNETLRWEDQTSRIGEEMLWWMPVYTH